tara:strand:+ start:313 stop:756 length:444 start_codon:yes stop_codon:yes gene_type:complete
MIFIQSIVLDVVLILSLLVTIFCCLILYKKLKDIKKSENEIKKVVAEFSFATERANTSLLSMKNSGAELTNFMQEKISESKSIIDDLKFLNEQGKKLSKNINSSELNYSGINKVNNNIEKNSSNIGHSSLPKSEMEKELISALEQSR